MLRVNDCEEKYEEVYLRWYELLVKRALHLSGRDQASAEDLVQDLFVELALSPPDFSVVRNIQGYLITILNNIHYSRMRRNGMGTLVQLSMADYDSAGIGLRMMLYSVEAQSYADQVSQMQARDELRKVCRYACVRKESSKIGGILILRFFHNYFSDEVAQVARVPRKMVYRWLQLARNEAQVYLNDPSRLHFIKPSPEANERELAPSRVSPAADESSIEAMLFELQSMILNARSGECPSLETLRSWYLEVGGRDEIEPIDGKALAHLVSCSRCLDSVNEMLGLAPLAERYLGEAVAKESNVDDDENDPNAGGNAGKAGPTPLEKMKRRVMHRVREVREHHPKELFIAVNGELICGQRISCDRCEQRLNLELNEIPQFIEILSEQGMRLAMLTLGGAPLEIHRQVSLSDGRILEVELSGNGAGPVLRVAYFDPSLREEVLQDEAVSAETAYESAEMRIDSRESWRKRLISRARGVRATLRDRLDLSPGRQAAALRIAVSAAAVGMIAVFFVWQSWRSQPVLAAPLLKRSIEAEQSAAPTSTEIIHRTLSLEERAVGNNALIARRLIEIWQGGPSSSQASTIRTVRRLYDENNQLIGGEWRNQDGSREIYSRRAGRSRPGPGVYDPSSLPRDAESAWRIDLTTSNFVALLNDMRLAVAEEKAETHLITWRSPAVADPQANRSLPRLISAKLILAKADLRPIEQAMVIQAAGAAREYRFIETGFNRYPRALVPSTVFNIDPELLSTNEESHDTSALIDKIAPIATPEPSPAPVNAPLEVQVIYLLGQENITLGEKAALKRLADGSLLLVLTIDDEKRKESILQILAPKIEDRSLNVEFRNQAQSEKAPSPSNVNPIEMSDSVAGAKPSEGFPEIREFVLRRWARPQQKPTEELIESEIMRVVSEIIGRAARAKTHALALKHAGGRFSQTQIEALDDETRVKWLAVLRSHAAACEYETLNVRRTLDAISQFPAAGNPEKKPTTPGDFSLHSAIEQLVKLTTANEAAIKTNFAGPRSKKAAAVIRGQPFLRGLQEAELLAASVRGLAEPQ